jgi:hypothetical protein
MKNLRMRTWTVGAAAACLLASTVAGQKQAQVPGGAIQGSTLSVQTDPFFGYAPLYDGLVFDGHAAIGRKPFWMAGVRSPRRGAVLPRIAALPRKQASTFQIQLPAQPKRSELSDRLQRMIAPALRKRGDGVALRIKGTLLPAQQQVTVQVTQTQTAYVLQVSDELAQQGGISDRRKANGGQGYVFGSLQTTSRAIASVLLGQARKKGGDQELRSRGLIREMGKTLARHQTLVGASPRQAAKR